MEIICAQPSGSAPATYIGTSCIVDVLYIWTASTCAIADDAEKATEPVTSTSSWAGATTVDPPPGNSNANAIAVPTVEVAAGYKGNGELGSLGL